MHKKILTLLVLTAISFSSFAQLRLAVGAGTDLYMSKYIVDDKLPNIDLKNYHSLAFNHDLHLNVGIDIANRLRFVTGLATSSKIDKADYSYLYPNVPGDYSYVIKNKYLTIPLSLTVNLVGKEAKSRLPIGFTADINMFNKQQITGATFDTTYTKAELDTAINATSMTVGFTLGYGYKFTDNLGLDALLFAKYDLAKFDNTNPEYNNYAFVGLNLTLYYVFGKKKD
ncbi:MAG: outer membrane beta-barrel protein [Bacteroidota bacterium]